MLNQRGPWLGQVRLAPAPSHPFLGEKNLLASAGAINDSSFAQVLSAPRAVVDFWSPTCPYCVAYKPIFEDVASQVGSNILMATVNVNDAPQSAGSYNIEGIPATILLVNGKEIGRIEGTATKEELLAAMSKAFGAGAVPVPAGGVPILGVVGGLAAVGVLGYLLFA